MKGIVKKATAVVLAVTVMCGAVMGISVTASAASLSAGALQYGADFSFLEGLFMSAGAGALGLDMLLKTKNDINNWDWGEVLDSPASQGQIDKANETIEKLYNNAVKDWHEKHGGGSGPTPTPLPDVSPPVTVAPINPDDVSPPEDWGTLKKNAQGKGILAMGAATAYCVKEAVKDWWDDVVHPFNIPEGADNEFILDASARCSGMPYYLLCNEQYNASLDGAWLHFFKYGALYNSTDTDCYVVLYGGYRYGFKTWYRDTGKIYSVDDSFDDLWSTTNCNSIETIKQTSLYNYFTNMPKFNSYSDARVYVEEQMKNSLPKTSFWPSNDLKDDYDNNRSPNLPELVAPALRLPTLDEIKDLWKQGTDDEENRPTYVTNFITNHTVQPTPEPEPTKKPEVNPNPGGGTDPDPEPTPSTTPAVVPDPGGGTDPQPSGSPDPNPDPGGGGDTDPDNPETPTPEEEASPYKTDLREIFPFCIPFDLIHLLKVFDAEAEAPVFEFPLDIEMDNPWTGEKVVDYHHTFELDMADYEPVIKILRIFQVIFFIIALMLITRQQMIKG